MYQFYTTPSQGQLEVLATKVIRYASYFHTHPLPLLRYSNSHWNEVVNTLIGLPPYSPHRDHLEVEYARQWCLNCNSSWLCSTTVTCPLVSKCATCTNIAQYNEVLVQLEYRTINPIITSIPNYPVVLQSAIYNQCLTTGVRTCIITKELEN